MKATSSLLATAMLLVSCGDKTQTIATTPAAPSEALSTVLAAAPEGEPQSIAKARTTAKPGDEITLSGRIMGHANPFTEGRAVFILGDPSVLTACSDQPDDECETPWDTCCDSPEDRKRGIATIQIVDTEGRVLKESIEGVSGLEKLATVTVTGQIAGEASADLLIVNARAIRAGK